MIMIMIFLASHHPRVLNILRGLFSSVYNVLHKKRFIYNYTIVLQSVISVTENLSFEPALYKEKEEMN